MHKNRMDAQTTEWIHKLTINCSQCSGLCCVALYCTKTDGFPADKAAGMPCQCLMSDFRCNIHSELATRNMRGCMAYDCFGAGQKVTQDCYPGITWNTHPELADEIFAVFLAIFQLHQMAWYLVESKTLVSEPRALAEIEALLSENQEVTSLPPRELLQFDIEQYRMKVNEVLKHICTSIARDTNSTKDYFGTNFKKANLDQRNFSMACMIAANLEGCSLRNTIFLGTDMRDANISNADLRESVFLTQMQVNAAKGNRATRLPEYLSYPDGWK